MEPSLLDERKRVSFTPEVDCHRCFKKNFPTSKNCKFNLILFVVNITSIGFPFYNKSKDMYTFAKKNGTKQKAVTYK